VKESDIALLLGGELDAARAERLASRDAAVPVQADLERDVVLTRNDLARLAEAHLAGGLSVATLTIVARAILASERITWNEAGDDGELIAEILWDWSAPDDQFPLTTQDVAAHRGRLLSSDKPSKSRMTSTN
jgi:hypothetical protein